MKFWDYAVHKLAYVMTDEMNSEAGGTIPQHMCLAMGWAMGFESRLTVGDEEEAQKRLDCLIEDFPYVKSILKEIETK